MSERKQSPEVAQSPEVKQSSQSLPKAFISRRKNDVKDEFKKYFDSFKAAPSVLKQLTEPDYEYLLSYTFLEEDSNNFLFLLKNGANPNAHLKDTFHEYSRPLPELIALYAPWKIEDKKKALMALAEKGAKLPAGIMKIFSGEPLQQTELMAKDTYGFTILHYLAANGFSEAIPGSNKNREATRTTIIATTPSSHLRIIENLLTETKFDIDAKSKTGETPIMLAAALGHLKTVQHFWESKANIEATNQDEDTTLTLAALNGETEVVRFLLKVKANINHKNKTKNTALTLAAFAGHMETVKCLIEEGKANIEAETNEGVTALGLASEKGHLEIVAYLIGKKANIDAGGEHGVTPLMFAAAAGQLEVVRYLVGEKASIEASDNIKGYTALILAAQQGHLKIVEYLVEKGANIWAKDEQGKTALDLAKDNGCSGVIEYLKSVAEKYSNATQHLLKKTDVTVSEPNPTKTPLHLASLKAGMFSVSNKNSQVPEIGSEVVQILKSHGAIKVS